MQKVLFEQGYNIPTTIFLILLIIIVNACFYGYLRIVGSKLDRYIFGVETVFDKLRLPASVRKSTSLFGIIFVNILLIIAVIGTIFNGITLHRQYKNGDYSLVSGIVRTEYKKFYIDNVEFRYSDTNFVSIKNGQKLTIGYIPRSEYSNTIVYIAENK